MVYQIKDNKLIIFNEDFNIESSNIILVTDSESFSHIADKYSELKINIRSRTYSCTQMEIHDNYIYSAFVIPSKLSTGKRNNFDLIMFKNRIIIIDDNNFIEKIIETLFDSGVRKKYSMSIFFYELLNAVISKDLLFLEGLEEKLSAVEEKIIAENFEKFNNKLSEIKKYLMVYYRHYSQLLLVCDTVFQTENEFFDDDSIRLFTLFSKRIERLKSETEILKEYSLQIQDMYQTEIGVRQNDVMKMLTIVTTIVLPLSLITGWYGMNFKYMPELGTRYGYYVLILISIIVVIGCIVLCKKKRYF